MSGPPEALVTSLVDGPSLVTAVQWHERCGSTNALAAEAAAAGAPEGLLVLTDEQTAGRGRQGRTWTAPPGTSLLLSLLLRPGSPAEAVRVLPLLAGLVLAETVARHLPETQVALKWPNDLLVADAKAAGILAEAVADGVVVGMGVNVDWRAVQQPAEFANATSLADAAGRHVDRWRLLAGIMGVFSQRYGQWRQEPAAFLDDYRARCATIGRDVRIELVGGEAVTGEATGVAADGAVLVRNPDGGTTPVSAGDVHHVR